MRNRGFSLIELLVAVLLLALAISGLVVLWGFAFNTTAHSQDIAVAYSIARQEIESARGRGYMALQAGTWEVGYDGEGHRTDDATSRFTARCKVEMIKFEGSEEDSRCLRTLRVQVVDSDRDRDPTRPAPLIFETTTYFTKGGV